MGDESKENFEYITNGRYLIEILDIESNKAYYTRRMGGLRQAVIAASEYSALSGLFVTIFDTKTGERI